MTFELTYRQKRKLIAWKDSLPKLPQTYFGAIGGGYSISFTPTGLGIIVIVSRSDKVGHKVDLTEYDLW